jgi:hypothetical protein
VTRRVLLAALLVLIAATTAPLALISAAPASRAAGLAVIPFPGTPDASPSTTIIFSSLRPTAIRSLRVIGSRTGRHAGRLTQLPDGAGAGFVPDAAFAPGERVSVSAVTGPGATILRYSFTVATRTNLSLAHRGVPGAVAGTEPTLSFHTDPGLRPPVVRASGDSDRSSGDIFLTPTGNTPQQGPMILNARGHLVWFDPLRRYQAINLKVQRYRGRPVLTWFKGTVYAGEDVIMNSAYRTMAIVRAGNGYSADLHEFTITPSGTAWLDAYVPVHTDLRSIGGPANGTVFDCVIQLVDIRTGKVLWEWHSLGHVPVRDSYTHNPNSLDIYDYFHLNSIQQLPNGDLLISARNTSALYEISRRTGRVIWTMGGKHSDFTMGRGANFEWQHDARLHSNGTLTLFDDAATPQEERQSSAKILRVNMRTLRVTLVRRYTHTPPVLSDAAGNAQLLPNGDMFVGWGAAPEFSEYSPDGRQIFAGTSARGVASYRAYRFPWRGQPRTHPKLAVGSAAGGTLTLYASWNGATGVSAWRVLGGARAVSLKRLTQVATTGFETAIHLSTSLRYFIVQALGTQGQLLGTSLVRAR